MQIPTIEPGMKIVQVGGKHFQQKIKRSRKVFKTPLAIRKKMSIAARRFKFPILTASAVGVPIAKALQSGGGLARSFTSLNGFLNFSDSMMRSYTGFSPLTATFYPQRMAVGLAPLGMLWGIKKTGIFRSINRDLGKARFPLRLS